MAVSVSIQLIPAVNLANRVAGSFGIGEVINLSCVVKPAVPGLPGIPGGIIYKVTKGSGIISAAAPLAATAQFTAAGKAEDVAISAYGANDPNKVLATAGFRVLVPNGLKFVQTGAIIHTQGAADCGFTGAIYLQPAGVSYQALQVREGEFKGKGTGYYKSQDNMLHPASNAALSIVSGNRVQGMDTIYSGIQQPPYSAGKFEWHIPWQYRLGNGDWVTFEYANHVEEITALGAVSIGKFNAGPFTKKVSDP